MDFNKVYYHCYGRIKRMYPFLTEQEVEDVTQEAVFMIWQKEERGVENQLFNYAIKDAFRKVIADLRFKKYHKKEVSLEVVGEKGYVPSCEEKLLELDEIYSNFREDRHYLIDLLLGGYTASDIARLVNVHPSRMSQIVKESVIKRKYRH